MKTVNATSLMAEARLTPFHYMIIAICSLIIIFDGYDLVVYGVALPQLMPEWGITPVRAGFIGSLALFGMMAGAILFGSLSDKLEKFGFSRKRVIAICIVIFSVFTAMCGAASSPEEFSVYRFIAGIGLGGVMPNVISLMTEYAPARLKSTLVALMFSGYAIGGMSAALLGIGLIETYGWRLLFYIAGLPVIFLAPMMYILPDSMDYLVRTKKQFQARGVLQRLVPNADIPEDALVVLDKANEKAADKPVKEIFSGGRLLSTIMFWCSIFMTLLLVYALGNWIPKLMVESGYELKASLAFLFSLNIGGMLGAILGGYLADRMGHKKVLLYFYCAGALALFLLSVKVPDTLVYLLIAIAGAASIGSQIVICSFMAVYYPAPIRSTGIGWGLGMGRIGAIVGPMLIGSVMGLNLPVKYNFIVLGVPCLIALVSVFLIGLEKRQQPAGQLATDTA